MVKNSRIAGLVWRAVALGMFVIAAVGVGLSLQYHGSAQL